MKVLLVAKPWKGGLAQYLFDALQDLFPGQAQWMTTYPDSLADYLAYRMDKHKWLCERVTRINASDYDSAIFINHIPAFRQLCSGRKHILWLTDAPTLTAGDCAAFERIYLSDTGYQENLLQMIEPARYQGELAFGFYPAIHRPAPAITDPAGICFIGNKDPQRDIWLSGLIACGVRPAVYGNYMFRHPLFWRHPGLFRPALANARMGEVYARHRVSLNIHAQVVRHGTNMRSFECAGYGIAQVVDYRDGLAQYFKSDTEILVSHTPSEMAAQVNFLLAHPDTAAGMAQRARQHALAEHSYYHRLCAILADWLAPAELAAAQNTCKQLTHYQTNQENLHDIP